MGVYVVGELGRKLLYLSYSYQDEARLKQSQCSTFMLKPVYKTCMSNCGLTRSSGKECRRFWTRISLKPCFFQAQSLTALIFRSEKCLQICGPKYKTSVFSASRTRH